MNYVIEIERNNVTLSQFLNYIDSRCKKLNIDFSIKKDDFLNPVIEYNNSYRVTNGIKYCFDGNRNYHVDGSDAPCEAEILTTLPLNFQTYILNFDGSAYNEICEFTFDKYKRGHGYYFQLNKDVE